MTGSKGVAAAVDLTIGALIGLALFLAFMGLRA